MGAVPLPLVQLPAQEILDASIKRGLCRVKAECVDAPALLAFWHLASFDAPTVALVWSLAFAWTAAVHLPLWTPILLVLMAWSVYIGDRLMDARFALRAGQLNRLRERHHFHWRHRHLLIPMATVAVAAAITIILAAMPLRALAPNSLLGATALAYFSGVHAKRKLPRLAPKEFLVGVIFTAGCALPAWIALRARVVPAAESWLFPATAIYFAVVAWLNCHAIASWESDQPRVAGSSSVLSWGAAVALAGLLLAGTALAVDSRWTALLIAGAASAMLLALLDFVRDRLTPLALRAAADFVLLTPAVVLPLAHWLA